MNHKTADLVQHIKSLIDRGYKFPKNYLRSIKLNLSNYAPKAATNLR